MNLRAQGFPSEHHTAGADSFSGEPSTCCEMNCDSLGQITVFYCFRGPRCVVGAPDTASWDGLYVLTPLYNSQYERFQQFVLK